jgi:transposase
MTRAADNHTDDTAALKAVIASQRTEIEHLKLLIAKLKRMQFGRRSEQRGINVDQLTLLTDVPPPTSSRSPLAVANPDTSSREPRIPVRKPLPSHLPRETQVHVCDNACCPDCGGTLRRIGEDVAEMLEYIPERFKVIRHVRPKYACGACETIVQAAAPERPIARGLAGPGLLAHVLVSKYADHLPLYRQSAIYAREGIDLSRSTLTGWVGECATLLQPLVEAIRRHALGGSTLHADDTPVPVLDPGRGRTKTARLWTYVRDERPAGGEAAPAVWFAYSPDRKGIHPQRHLHAFRGTLHADGYAGFGKLFQTDAIEEAACWAHARRKLFEVVQAQASPLAATALNQIGALYAIESDIRGRPPDERRAVRQARAVPVLTRLHAWLEYIVSQVPRKSELADAVRYALARWKALTRYGDDGRLEIDNNAAERALRAVALGRKNYLFAGSDNGGESAAALYTLLGTASLNGMNPEAYLRHVIERIATHPINRIDELLPWNVAYSREASPLAAA